jgi:diaminohydroxyphosphoribosylaminopyrimidine deaminase/5-amino-6-(5-phosphoribosylamino)uracil reductase
MRQALDLASRGQGNVSPNPLVGAVLVRRGKVVGSGHHRLFGGSHAEVAALKRAGAAARGAVLYTNLEPCAHQGKTPPCVAAIVQAGVIRVVAAIRDPHPGVRGRGFRRLRQAGVPVETGLLANEARELNAAYLKHVAVGRPLVTLKAGMSLDGRIAARSGTSRWITSARARAAVHELRARADAVLVGSRTARQDDPLLTARRAGQALRRQPLRIILDSAYSLPPSARLLGQARGGPVVIYGVQGHAGRRRALERAGAEVVVLAGRGRPDPGLVLDNLGQRGVADLLVEGGGEIGWSFLAGGHVDRSAWFVAPRLLGGGGVPVLGGRGAADPKWAVRVCDLEVRRVGPDLLVTGKPVLARQPGE